MNNLEEENNDSISIEFEDYKKLFHRHFNGIL